MDLECPAYVATGASPLQRCALRQDHARRAGAANWQSVIEWLYEGGLGRMLGETDVGSGLERPTYALRIRLGKCRRPSLSLKTAS